MPHPPSERPDLDHSNVAANLSTVRKTTKLGTHKEPAFKAEDHEIRDTGEADVPNQWAVVYGRVVFVPNLTEKRGGPGCGGFDVPVILMATPFNVHGVRGDGSFVPADDKGGDTTVQPHMKPERSR